MSAKTLDFTNLGKINYSYPNAKEDDLVPIRIGGNGLQLYRNLTKTDGDEIYGANFVGQGTTSVTHAVKATDWDLGKFSIVTDVNGEQTFAMEMGVGKEFYLKKLIINCSLFSNTDEINEPVNILAADSVPSAYIQLMIEISDNQIIGYMPHGEGIYTKVVKIITHGTKEDENKLIISEIIVNKVMFLNPNITVSHNDYNLLDVLTSITVTKTEPVGTEIRYQVTKDDSPYFWNGSSWVEVTSNTVFDFEYSNTEADINTNASTFPLTVGEKSKISIKAIFQSTENLTPSLKTVVIT